MMLTWLFIFVYGFTKGMQDYCMIYQPSSWKDKYKQPFQPIPKGWYGWYHRVNGLSYREKFFLSGTLLVSLTDWWHFFGLIRFLSVYLLFVNIAEQLYWQPFPLYWLGFGLSYKLLRLLWQKQ